MAIKNEILGLELSEFKEYIEELLQKDGKIVVTKQAGLFVVCEVGGVTLLVNNQWRY